MKSNRKLDFCETGGSVFWFLADACWLFEWETALLIFSIPTIVLNVLVFRHIEKTWANICVTAAMNSWVLMNIFWALGDLHSSAQSVELAKAFFVLGLVFLFLAPAKGYKGAINAFAQYFKRFRFKKENNL